MTKNKIRINTDGNNSILTNLLRILFVALLSLIVLVCFLFYKRVRYAGNRTSWFILSNPLLIIIGIAVLGLLFIIVNKIKINKKIPTRLIFALICTITFLLQLFVIKQYYFETAWDAATVRDSAIRVADGQPADPDWWPDYYSINSNNRTIVSLFVGVLQIAKFLNYDEPLFTLIIFQCLVSVIAGVLLFATIKKITGKYKYAWFGWLLYFLLVLCSPWMSIPYSDGVGMIFPILLVFLYTINTNNIGKMVLKWLAIGITGYTSLQIKPQATIVLIAILVMQIYYIIFNKIKNKQPIFSLNRIYNGIALVGGCLISLLAITNINNYLIPIESNRSLPLTHFLMMGMNTKGFGVYNGDDVQLISLDGSYVGGNTSREPTRIVTTDEIVKRNINVITQRLRDMGVVGFSKHMVKKALTNFNDGLFAWSGEGGFYYKVYETENSLQDLVRRIYYMPGDDKNNGINKNDVSYFKYLQTFMQIIWMGVLFFTIFAVVKKPNKYVLTIALAIIGLIIYEQLFEARARYIFTFVPLFITMSIYGMINIHNYLFRKDNLKVNR